MIPKIIHAIWLGVNEMPADQKQFVEGWKKRCQIGKSKSGETMI